MPDKVVIGMPTRDRMANLDAAHAFFFPSKKYETLPLVAAGCEIAGNRNALLCQALNKREEGFTRMAMIDYDVAPERDPPWLDTLMAEMSQVDADMISVACPLRFDGIRKHSNIAREAPTGVERYSMKEIFGLPPTFTSPELLCGAGLILVRIDRPWAEQLYFEQQSKIGKNARGEWGVQPFGEDFQFTKLVRSLGGKVFVTRKVQLYHGTPENHNRPF
jgi:hypothetical protein